MSKFVVDRNFMFADGPQLTDDLSLGREPSLQNLVYRYYKDNLIPDGKHDPEECTKAYIARWLADNVKGVN